VAYYTTSSGGKLDENELISYLSSRIPDYMIPSIFVLLETLPLTVNGKLDRKALSDPEFRNDKDSYVAPRNEIESKLCSIWEEVLSLPSGRVGINDNFFHLGGNSILAIRLLSKINQKFNSYLKVADIFIYKDIKSLSLKVIQTKNSYQTIVKLNNTYDKPNMFMIHPGTGGCEAYISLAQQLTSSFSCYGVDNYNLHSYKKIEQLNKLAEYYLGYIDKINSTKKGKIEEYHLLGWSLGGLIAIEIANILEKRGVQNIRLYILDTFIYDDYLSSKLLNISSEEKEKTRASFLEVMQKEGYDSIYINKVIANLDTEDKLMSEHMPYLLNNSKILLFKAMLRDPRLGKDGYDSIFEYTKTLKYNNIDRVIKNTKNIRLINIENVHHRDLLTAEDILVKEMKCKTTKNKDKI
jgi:pimeloyl-ACP methyl ester carboxylesterase